jgi:transposase
MKKYKEWNPRQSFLLPQSPIDWLPDGHLAYFILDILDEIDIQDIESIYQSKDVRGRQPYPPLMMVGLLLYGYCVGVFSSRKLEKATYEDIGFRVLAGGHHPDHTRISEFRRVHLETLRGLFVQVLMLCREAGLVKLGHVALDGTKIQANASKHKAMSYERMQQAEKRLGEEVEVLLKRAEETDALEDSRFGKEMRGDEVPEELRRRETRLERIREAKVALEQEALKARARQLQDQAERARQRSETHEDETERKRAATMARKKESEASELRGSDGPVPPLVTPEGLPKHEPKTTTQGKPDKKAQRNFTDPDSRIMISGGNYTQGYNGQAAVDEEHQVIVACALTNQCPDNGNLLPMLQQIQVNCGQTPDVMTTDKGYWAPGTATAAAAQGTEVYVATERRKHWGTNDTATRGSPSDDADELEQMRHKVRTEKGRALYARRKVIVEPVFGQIKEARGFARFLLRGLDKAAGEWSLVTTGHNLLKLYRARYRQKIAQA